MPRPIYLDYNATTPVAPEVAGKMRPFLEEQFGNPSSSHWYGRQTSRAVAVAREQVAQLLGCSPDEVIFTSGGSEANNMAIQGVARSLRDRGRHIVTSAIEHPAVTEVCRHLEREGFRITELPVDGDGLVNPDDLKAALSPDTILVTIMHANNEVGTIEPIVELAAIARKADVLFHTDAAQSVGKIPVRVENLGVDLLSVAAHKFYGPKGVGALFVRQGVELPRLIHGADHERNRRAGTENVLEIVGLGAAAELARHGLDRHSAHMRTMRDRLESGLRKACPDLRVNGDSERRLPNTLSVGFPGVEANTLLDELGDRVAASAGAACHTDQVTVSTVLQAMRVPIEYAMGTVRLSTGRMTSEDDVDQAVVAISSALQNRR